MPFVLYKTLPNDSVPPDGWKLVKQLRGRAIYARYNESDVVMAGSEVAAVVPSEKEANQLIENLSTADENVLVNLLCLVNID